MRSLAEYVMRGRRQAVLMVLLFNLIPFLGWISNVIMGLVTLRKGAKEGLLIFLWVILPSLVLAIIGYTQFWFYNVLGGSLVIYLLALTLRNTNSWPMVLFGVMLIGIVSVIAAHIYNPNIANIWSKQLTDYLQTFKVQWGTTVEYVRMQRILPALAKIGTGIQIAFLLLIDLVVLLLARWVQAMLYNPGALRQELLNIRLGLLAVITMAVLIIGGMGGLEFAIDSMPVVLMPFVLAGLSLLHGMIALAKISKVWLFSFYGLWILFFPYLTMLLIMAALIDCWWDFRRRLQLRNI